MIFSKVFLSKSAFINIYSGDNTFKYGPITRKDISENGVLWTDLIKGDHINIELVEPNPTGVNEVQISNIIHGYKNTFTQNNFGNSFSCNIDINCPQGAVWHNDADAVAMILLDAATRWCTGSLINNTFRDFKAYFLTAFHCIDISGDDILSNTEKSNVTNWLFRFRYESQTCGGGEGTNFITFNGANFRAAYQPSDMTLLELSTKPTIENCLRFAGWSRSTSAASSGTGIHHPSGDVKKISIDNNTLTTNNSTINWSGGTSSPSNSHWVVGFDQGTTEGGSSGSPIFDQNHRIVGQLHGGANGCAPITKYYGKFNISWNGGGTNDSRLSNWLDPINSGTLTMDNEAPVLIVGPSQFCTSQNYSILGLTTGATVTWSASGSIAISGSTTANPVLVSRVYDGIGSLTATISSICGNITISKNDISASYPTPIIHGNTVVAPYQGEAYYVDALAGATNYQWSIMPNPSYFSISNNGANSINVQNFNPSGTSTYFLRLRVTTPCGIIKSDLVFEIQEGSSNQNLKVYPNPASTELHVEYISEDEKTVVTYSRDLSASKPSREVKLFNEKGEVFKPTIIANTQSKTDIDIRNIPNGTYFLHIIQGEETIKKQIIVNHQR